jgi:hypothetical protein
MGISRGLKEQRLVGCVEQPTRSYLFFRSQYVSYQRPIWGLKKAYAKLSIAARIQTLAFGNVQPPDLRRSDLATSSPAKALDDAGTAA